MTIPLKARPRIAVSISGKRKTLNITPAARTSLRGFLSHDLAGTGIGYSEFILNSIALWREPGHDLHWGARILPLDEVRVPIQVAPEVAQDLSWFLLDDLASTGIGYSEFILRSIAAWRDIS